MTLIHTITFNFTMSQLGNYFGGKFKSILFLCLTTFSTLLFILCFIHFLKNNHHNAPPIVSNELQDYSTTKSIYFILSFYFFLWTVLFTGLTLTSTITKNACPRKENKSGKAVIVVVLILLALITLLLLSIDVYTPWISNFVQGNIFSYCVQVSGLITLCVGLSYFLALLLCSNKTISSSPTTTPTIIQHMLNAQGGEEEGRCKCSYANPCYNFAPPPGLVGVGVSRV